MFQGYVLASLIALPQILWISWRLLAVGCYHILFFGLFCDSHPKTDKVATGCNRSLSFTIMKKPLLPFGFRFPSQSLKFPNSGAQPPCWTSRMCSQAGGFGPARHCRTPQVSSVSHSFSCFVGHDVFTCFTHFGGSSFF